MPVDEENLTRILEAVGLASTPVNRRLLRTELGWCGTWHAVASEARLHKRLENRLKILSKATKHCLQLLKEENVYEEISSRLLLTEECPRAAIQRLFEAGEAALKKEPNPTEIPVRFADCSAFEYVAGYRLPRVFKKHFGQAATVQRKTDGTPDGPYIRFAEAALAGLGISNHGRPYRPESIAKALANVKAGRARRARFA
jgi:hypothetical protein